MNAEKTIRSNKSIKVFYDGQCPLCRREIQHYQNMRGADVVEWIDISKDAESLNHYELSFDQAMARFHVLDDQGCWQTGVYGFVELWNHLPGMHWLASILKRSQLLPLIDRFYSIFARYRVRKKCSEDACLH